MAVIKTCPYCARQLFERGKGRLTDVPMSAKRGYYEVLGVPWDASEEWIQRARLEFDWKVLMSAKRNYPVLPAAPPPGIRTIADVSKGNPCGGRKARGNLIWDCVLRCRGAYSNTPRQGDDDGQS